MNVHSFGKVVMEHRIGDHCIVEFEVGAPWRGYEGQVKFSVGDVSYDTLDQAIIGSICNKYGAIDPYLAIYVCRLIPGIQDVA